MAKLSKEKVRNAIPGTAGIITTIAMNAGVSRKSLYAYLKKHSELWGDIDEEKAKVVDLAENRLVKRIERDDWKAVSYMLDKKGGDRGYGDRQVVEARVGGLGVSDLVSVFEEAKRLREGGE